MCQLYRQSQDTLQPMAGTTYWCSMKHCTSKRCEMQNTLINPNQCRHFRELVQDKPYDAKKLMAISIPDSEFTTCLQSEGNIIFLDTWYRSQKYLEAHQHIKMTSCHHLNPHQIQFPQIKYGVQEEIKGRNVSAASIFFSGGAPPEVGYNLAANRGEATNNYLLKHTQ